MNALNSVKVVRCDEVQLRIAGLSLAGWNVIASAVLAVYAALAARAVEASSRDASAGTKSSNSTISTQALAMMPRSPRLSNKGSIAPSSRSEPADERHAEASCSAVYRSQASFRSFHARLEDDRRDDHDEADKDDLTPIGRLLGMRTLVTVIAPADERLAGASRQMGV